MVLTNIFEKSQNEQDFVNQNTKNQIILRKMQNMTPSFAVKTSVHAKI